MRIPAVLMAVLCVCLVLIPGCGSDNGESLGKKANQAAMQVLAEIGNEKDAAKKKAILAK